MSTTLRTAMIVLITLGLCGVPAVASATPAASAAPAPTMPALAATSAAAPAPIAAPKRKCYKIVKGKNGKKYKKWYVCTAQAQKPKKPDLSLPSPKGKNCSVILGVKGGTRPGHRAALDYMASGVQGASHRQPRARPDAARGMRDQVRDLEANVLRQGCAKRTQDGQPRQHHRQPLRPRSRRVLTGGLGRPNRDARTSVFATPMVAVRVGTPTIEESA